MKRISNNIAIANKYILNNKKCINIEKHDNEIKNKLNRLFALFFILTTLLKCNKQFQTKNSFSGSSKQNTFKKEIIKELGLMKNICASCNKGATLKCSGCKMTYYCSKKCQINDWKPNHKKLCKKIRKNNNIGTANKSNQNGQNTKLKNIFSKPSISLTNIFSIPCSTINYYDKLPSKDGKLQKLSLEKASKLLNCTFVEGLFIDSKCSVSKLIYDKEELKQTGIISGISNIKLRIIKKLRYIIDNKLFSICRLNIPNR